MSHNQRLSNPFAILDEVENSTGENTQNRDQIRIEKHNQKGKTSNGVFQKVVQKQNGKPNHQHNRKMTKAEFLKNRMQENQNNSKSNYVENRPTNRYGNRPTKHFENRPTNRFENTPTKHFENRPTKHFENRPTNRFENSPTNRAENIPPNPVEKSVISNIEHKPTFCIERKPIIARHIKIFYGVENKFVNFHVKATTQIGRIVRSFNKDFSHLGERGVAMYRNQSLPYYTRIGDCDILDWEVIELVAGMELQPSSVN